MIRAILFDRDGVLIDAGMRHLNTSEIRQRTFQALSCDPEECVLVENGDADDFSGQGRTVLILQKVHAQRDSEAHSLARTGVCRAA